MPLTKPTLLASLVGLAAIGGISISSQAEASYNADGVFEVYKVCSGVISTDLTGKPYPNNNCTEIPQPVADQPAAKQTAYAYRNVMEITTITSTVTTTTHAANNNSHARARYCPPKGAHMRMAARKVYREPAFIW